MTKDKTKSSKSVKNYIILIIVSVLTILLTLYVCRWIKIYKDEELSKSPLIGKVNEVSLMELKESLAETNEAILYFGYTMDEETYFLEEKMAHEIEKSDLKENVYYVNVKDYLANDEYKIIINNIMSDLDDKEITAPCLIYLKRGVPIKIISSNKKMITVKDFKNLLSLIETE